MHVLARSVPDAERELVEGPPPVDSARGIGEGGAESVEGLVVRPPRDGALEEVREALVRDEARARHGNSSRSVVPQFR